MFDDYVETHEENTITNLMEPRNRLSIYMGSSGNIQGSIKFICVNTGNKIVRQNYT